jgi:accessory gene regulator protein AgrB
LAPAAGVGIAEAVRLVTKKRRSKKLFRLVSIGIILGGLPLIVITLINLLLRLSAGAFNLFSLLPLGYQVLYLVLAVPSAYYRLSGSRRL